jgi:FAD synthase
VEEQVDKTTHQLTAQVLVAALDCTDKDLVVLDFTLRGVELIHQAVAATQDLAELEDTMVKTRGVVVEKALITSKAEPMVAVVAAREQVGQHRLETVILELFEYYGELL